MNSNEAAIVKLVHQTFPNCLPETRLSLLLYLTDCSIDPQLTTYEYTRQVSGPYTSTIKNDIKSLLDEDILRIVTVDGKKGYAIDYYTKSQQYQSELSQRQQTYLENTYQATVNLSRSEIINLIYTHPQIASKQKYAMLSTDITHTI